LVILVLVYVDDLIVTDNNTLELPEFTKKLNRVVALKDLGNLHYFLGIEAIRDETGENILKIC
jgi:histone deacetylase 1/2